jgi:hypothetical protein
VWWSLGLTLVRALTAMMLLSPADTLHFAGEESRDGKVVHETRYFAQPFLAPAWHSGRVAPAAVPPPSLQDGEQSLFGEA